MIPAPFSAYHIPGTSIHTAEHKGNLATWDALAANPDMRESLSIDDVLAWLMWNDPNGAWGEIADARRDPSTDPHGEFDVSDEEIREAFSTMLDEE